MGDLPELEKEKVNSNSSVSEVVTFSVYLVKNGLVVLHSTVFLGKRDLLGEVSRPVCVVLYRMASVRLGNQDGVRDSCFGLDCLSVRNVVVTVSVNHVDWHSYLLEWDLFLVVFHVNEHCFPECFWPAST